MTMGPEGAGGGAEGGAQVGAAYVGLGLDASGFEEEVAQAGARFQQQVAGMAAAGERISTVLQDAEGMARRLTETMLAAGQAQAAVNAEVQRLTNINPADLEERWSTATRRRTQAEVEAQRTRERSTPDALTQQTQAIADTTRRITIPGAGTFEVDPGGANARALRAVAVAAQAARVETEALQRSIVDAVAQAERARRELTEMQARSRPQALQEFVQQRAQAPPDVARLRGYGDIQVGAENRRQVELAFAAEGRYQELLRRQVQVWRDIENAAARATREQLQAEQRARNTPERFMQAFGRYMQTPIGQRPEEGGGGALAGLPPMRPAGPAGGGAAPLPDIDRAVADARRQRDEFVRQATQGDQAMRQTVGVAMGAVPPTRPPVDPALLQRQIESVTAQYQQNLNNAKSIEAQLQATIREFGPDPRFQPIAVTGAMANLQRLRDERAQLNQRLASMRGGTPEPVPPAPPPTVPLGDIQQAYTQMHQRMRVLEPEYQGRADLGAQLDEVLRERAPGTRRTGAGVHRPEWATNYEEFPNEALIGFARSLGQSPYDPSWDIAGGAPSSEADMLRAQRRGESPYRELLENFTRFRQVAQNVRPEDIIPGTPIQLGAVPTPTLQQARATNRAALAATAPEYQRLSALRQALQTLATEHPGVTGGELRTAAEQVLGQQETEQYRSAEPLPIDAGMQAAIDAAQARQAAAAPTTPPPTGPAAPPPAAGAPPGPVAPTGPRTAAELQAEIASAQDQLRFAQGWVGARGRAGPVQDTLQAERMAPEAARLTEHLGRLREELATAMATAGPTAAPTPAGPLSPEQQAVRMQQQIDQLTEQIREKEAQAKQTAGLSRGGARAIRERVRDLRGERRRLQRTLDLLPASTLGAVSGTGRIAAEAGAEEPAAEQGGLFGGPPPTPPAPPVTPTTLAEPQALRPVATAAGQADLFSAAIETVAPAPAAPVAPTRAVPPGAVNAAQLATDLAHAREQLSLAQRGLRVAEEGSSSWEDFTRDLEKWTARVNRLEQQAARISASVAPPAAAPPPTPPVTPQPPVEVQRGRAELDGALTRVETTISRAAAQAVTRGPLALPAPTAAIRAPVQPPVGRLTSAQFFEMRAALRPRVPIALPGPAIPALAGAPQYLPLPPPRAGGPAGPPEPAPPTAPPPAPPPTAPRPPTPLPPAPAPYRPFLESLQALGPEYLPRGLRPIATTPYSAAERRRIAEQRPVTPPVPAVPLTPVAPRPGITQPEAIRALERGGGVTPITAPAARAQMEGRGETLTPGRAHFWVTPEGQVLHGPAHEIAARGALEALGTPAQEWPAEQFLAMARAVRVSASTAGPSGSGEMGIQTIGRPTQAQIAALGAMRPQPGFVHWDILGGPPTFAGGPPGSLASGREWPAFLAAAQPAVPPPPAEPAPTTVVPAAPPRAPRAPRAARPVRESPGHTAANEQYDRALAAASAATEWPDIKNALWTMLDVSRSAAFNPDITERERGTWAARIQQIRQTLAQHQAEGRDVRREAGPPQPPPTPGAAPTAPLPPEPLARQAPAVPQAAPPAPAPAPPVAAPAAPPAPVTRVVPAPPIAVAAGAPAEPVTLAPVGPSPAARLLTGLRIRQAARDRLARQLAETQEGLAPTLAEPEPTRAWPRAPLGPTPAAPRGPDQAEIAALLEGSRQIEEESDRLSRDIARIRAEGGGGRGAATQQLAQLRENRENQRAILSRLRDLRATLPDWAARYARRRAVRVEETVRRPQRAAGPAIPSAYARVERTLAEFEGMTQEEWAAEQERTQRRLEEQGGVDWRGDIGGEAVRRELEQAQPTLPPEPAGELGAGERAIVPAAVARPAPRLIPPEAEAARAAIADRSRARLLAERIAPITPTEAGPLGETAAPLSAEVRAAIGRAQQAAAEQGRGAIQFPATYRTITREGRLAGWLAMLRGPGGGQYLARFGAEPVQRYARGQPGMQALGTEVLRRGLETQDVPLLSALAVPQVEPPPFAEGALETPEEPFTGLGLERGRPTREMQAIFDTELPAEETVAQRTGAEAAAAATTTRQMGRVPLPPVLANVPPEVIARVIGAVRARARQLSPEQTFTRFAAADLRNELEQIRRRLREAEPERRQVQPEDIVDPRDVRLFWQGRGASRRPVGYAGQFSPEGALLPRFLARFEGLPNAPAGPVQLFGEQQLARVTEQLGLTTTREFFRPEDLQGFQAGGIAAPALPAGNVTTPVGEQIQQLLASGELAPGAEAPEGLRPEEGQIYAALQRYQLDVRRGLSGGPALNDQERAEQERQDQEILARLAARRAPVGPEVDEEGRPLPALTMEPLNRLIGDKREASRRAYMETEAGLRAVVLPTRTAGARIYGSEAEERAAARAQFAAGRGTELTEEEQGIYEQLTRRRRAAAAPTQEVRAPSEVLAGRRSARRAREALGDMGELFRTRQPGQAQVGFVTGVDPLLALGRGIGGLFRRRPAARTGRAAGPPAPPLRQRLGRLLTGRQRAETTAGFASGADLAQILLGRLGGPQAGAGGRAGAERLAQLMSEAPAPEEEDVFPEVDEDDFEAWLAQHPEEAAETTGGAQVQQPEPEEDIDYLTQQYLREQALERETLAREGFGARHENEYQGLRQQMGRVGGYRAFAQTPQFPRYDELAQQRRAALDRAEERRRPTPEQFWEALVSENRRRNRAGVLEERVGPSSVEEVVSPVERAHFFIHPGGGLIAGRDFHSELVENAFARFRYRPRGDAVAEALRLTGAMRLYTPRTAAQEVYTARGQAPPTPQQMETLRDITARSKQFGEPRFEGGLGGGESTARSYEEFERLVEQARGVATPAVLSEVQQARQSAVMLAPGESYGAPPVVLPPPFGGARREPYVPFSQELLRSLEPGRGLTEAGRNLGGSRQLNLVNRLRSDAARQARELTAQPVPNVPAPAVTLPARPPLPLPSRPVVPPAARLAPTRRGRGRAQGDIDDWGAWGFQRELFGGEAAPRRGGGELSAAAQRGIEEGWLTVNEPRDPRFQSEFMQLPPSAFRQGRLDLFGTTPLPAAPTTPAPPPTDFAQQFRYQQRRAAAQRAFGQRRLTPEQFAAGDWPEEVLLRSGLGQVAWPPPVTTQVAPASAALQAQFARAATLREFGRTPTLARAMPELPEPRADAETRRRAAELATQRAQEDAEDRARAAAATAATTTTQATTGVLSPTQPEPAAPVARQPEAAFERRGIPEVTALRNALADAIRSAATPEIPAMQAELDRLNEELQALIERAEERDRQFDAVRRGEGGRPARRPRQAPAGAQLGFGLGGEEEEAGGGGLRGFLTGRQRAQAEVGFATGAFLPAALGRATRGGASRIRAALYRALGIEDTAPPAVEPPAAAPPTALTPFERQQLTPGRALGPLRGAPGTFVGEIAPPPPLPPPPLTPFERRQLTPGRALGPLRGAPGTFVGQIAPPPALGRPTVAPGTPLEPLWPMVERNPPVWPPVVPLTAEQVAERVRAFGRTPTGAVATPPAAETVVAAAAGAAAGGAVRLPAAALGPDAASLARLEQAANELNLLRQTARAQTARGELPRMGRAGTEEQNPMRVQAADWIRDLRNEIDQLQNQMVSGERQIADVRRAGLQDETNVRNVRQDGARATTTGGGAPPTPPPTAAGAGGAEPPEEGGRGIGARIAGGVRGAFQFQRVGPRGSPYGRVAPGQRIDLGGLLRDEEGGPLGETPVTQELYERLHREALPQLRQRARQGDVRAPGAIQQIGQIQNVAQVEADAERAAKAIDTVGHSAGNARGFVRRFADVFALTPQNLLRAGFAITGLGLGINIFAGIVRQLRDAVLAGTEAFSQHQQAVLNLQAAYGTAASAQQNLAGRIGRETLRPEGAIAQAMGTGAAQQLVQFGTISPAQQAGVAALGGWLERIHGIDTKETAQDIAALYDAIQKGGDVEALNIHLSDQYMERVSALGPAFRTLTPDQQAQQRYLEYLRQVHAQEANIVAARGDPHAAQGILPTPAQPAFQGGIGIAERVGLGPEPVPVAPGTPAAAIGGAPGATAAAGAPAAAQPINTAAAGATGVTPAPTTTAPVVQTQTLPDGSLAYTDAQGNPLTPDGKGGWIVGQAQPPQPAPTTAAPAAPPGGAAAPPQPATVAAPTGQVQFPAPGATTGGGAIAPVATTPGQSAFPAAQVAGGGEGQDPVQRLRDVARARQALGDVEGARAASLAADQLAATNLAAAANAPPAEARITPDVGGTRREEATARLRAEGEKFFVAGAGQFFENLGNVVRETEGRIAETLAGSPEQQQQDQYRQQALEQLGYKELPPALPGGQPILEDVTMQGQRDQQGRPVPAHVFTAGAEEDAARARVAQLQTDIAARATAALQNQTTGINAATGATTTATQATTAAAQATTANTQATDANTQSTSSATEAIDAHAQAAQEAATSLAQANAAMTLAQGQTAAYLATIAPRLAAAQQEQQVAGLIQNAPGLLGYSPAALQRTGAAAGQEAVTNARAALGAEQTPNQFVEQLRAEEAQQRAQNAVSGRPVTEYSRIAEAASRAAQAQRADQARQLVLSWQQAQNEDTISSIQNSRQRRELQATMQLNDARRQTLQIQDRISPIMLQQAELQDRMTMATRQNLGLQSQLAQAQLAALPATFRQQDVQYQSQLANARIQAYFMNQIAGVQQPELDVGAQIDQIRESAFAAPQAALDTMQAQRQVQLAQRPIEQEQFQIQLRTIPLQEEQRALEDQLIPLNQRLRIEEATTQAIRNRLELQALADPEQGRLINAQLRQLDIADQQRASAAEARDAQIDLARVTQQVVGQGTPGPDQGGVFGTGAVQFTPGSIQVNISVPDTGGALTGQDIATAAQTGLLNALIQVRQTTQPTVPAGTPAGGH